MRQEGTQLGADDRAELLELIELQTDRLSRLVTNLLDMTRIESGALELRPTTIGLDELVDESLGSLAGIVAPERVTVDLPADLPLLRIDHVLINQVLANLLENADRLAPGRSPILVAARVVPPDRGRSRRDLGAATRVRALPPPTATACSRCSARTAAGAGPVSGWPSPRPSSRPMAAGSGSTPT